LIRNAKSAGETVIAIPQEVAESGSAAGAGKTVLKAIPVAIIRPLIGASGAVSNTLMGIRNTLDSNQQQNIEDVPAAFGVADGRNTSVDCIFRGGISTVVQHWRVVVAGILVDWQHSFAAA
jgi:Autophagy-related protein C terminal domain